MSTSGASASDWSCGAGTPAAGAGYHRARSLSDAGTAGLPRVGGGRGDVIIHDCGARARIPLDWRPRCGPFFIKRLARSEFGLGERRKASAAENAILPAEGGEPRRITALAPSYWHGWSPDGKTLVYCAERSGEYDVYAFAAEVRNSQGETRLTSAKGLDDGPDYSPDGLTIFFNSDRTGAMRIWRMNPDGSDQRQVSFDEEYGDWFPHPSPDGKWLVFLSYDKSVQGHPANKDVALRIMPLAGGKPRLLARLFGGQGTINVPSWSPDSKQVAFVAIVWSSLERPRLPSPVDRARFGGGCVLIPAV